MKRTNFEIVMRILTAGLPVEMEGMTWQLDVEGKLCWVAKGTKPNVNGDMTGYVSDISLNGFIAMCNKLDSDWLFLRACEAVINR